MFILAIPAGVYLEFGLGWSLVVGGVLGAATALLVMDVDEKEGKK